MENISNKIVRIISQKIEYDFEIPFKFKNISSSVGSGFFIDLKGYIITCSHVIENSKEVFLELPSIGRNKFKCEIISICPYYDIALLKIINYKNKEFLELGSGNDAKNGSTSYAVGYPLGQDNLKITKGIISGKENGEIQTDTPINPGNSGGPLIVDNKVIGINASGYDDSQNVAYSVPVDYFKLIKNEMMKNKYLERPDLGINYNYVNEDILINSKCKKGIYINYVNKNSPIYTTGLKNGDILCSINNIKLDNYGLTNEIFLNDKKDINEIIFLMKYNQKVNIEYSRYNKLYKKTFNFNLFDKGIKEIYPLYEKFDYIIIGGLILINLNLNLLNQIKKIRNKSQNLNSLTIYNEIHNQEEPVIVVSNILPNSIFDTEEILAKYDIIEKINGNKVKKINDIRQIIKKKPIKHNKKKYLEIQTKDNYKTLINYEKIIENNEKISNTFNFKTEDIF